MIEMDTPEMGRKVEMELPKRADGTVKSFFYDPQFPGHIIHNDREAKMLRTICVGHTHG